MNIYHILILISVLILSSCANESKSQTCKSNSDCESREYCENKKCLPACLDMGCGWDNDVNCGICSGNDYCEDNICINKCENIECGENKGAQCGECDTLSYCENNQCIKVCENMACGQDNGINCGECDTLSYCENNQCIKACENMACGQDNGINCGECDTLSYCENNQCIKACENMACGQDNGINCGECDNLSYCENNQCIDVCVGMNCGEDQGFSCGQCNASQICGGNNICIDTMVTIPEGSFMMGCDSLVQDDCASDDQKHEVFLSSYKIDLFEVTVNDFKNCVLADVCSEDDFRPSSESVNCNYGNTTKGNNPMNCVKWDAAKRYCEWLGKRLPTEAEWEKAARGTDERMYAWGNESPSCTYAVYEESINGCGMDSTWDIASKPLGNSFYGIYDMTGNVSEWVSDYYDSSYYSSSPYSNPTGPDMGNEKSFRGGSWYDTEELLKSYLRGHCNPGFRRGDNGFRCAKSE